jgi:hypothetical protein
MTKKLIKKDFHLNTSLGEVKDFLRENYEKGCECPACGRVVELRRRGLNSSMAYAVMIMYRLMMNSSDPNKYFKMNEEIAKLKIPSSNIEYSKLAYWKLAEQNPVNENKKTKTSGYWRLTQKGIQFALSQISVPKYVYVYNNQVRKISEERIDIKAALENKFDYSEFIRK